MNFDEITNRTIFTLLCSSETSSDEEDVHLGDLLVIVEEELQQQKLKSHRNQRKKRMLQKKKLSRMRPKSDAAPRAMYVPKVTGSAVINILDVKNEQLITYLDNWEQIKSEEFYTLFRMQKDSFYKILQSFENFLQNHQNVKQVRFRKQNDRSKMLLMFLIYAGHQISLGTLSDKLKIYRRTLLKLIDNVMDFFVSLASEKIRQPESEEEKQASANDFFTIGGLKGVIGCIEKLTFHFGLHESLREKKPNSFTVELACDAFGRIIGYDTETLDSTLAEMCQEDFCFLASLKFSLRQWTITPCDIEIHNSRIIDANKQLFNEKFLMTFAVLQEAVHQLQQRFQQLLCIDAQRLIFARRLLYACCGLHNFLLECSDCWLAHKDFNSTVCLPIIIDPLVGVEKLSELDRFSCPLGIEKREHMIYGTSFFESVEEQEIVVE